MEIAGYAGAFLIGLTLGLMGSGGSILTVPLLVYLFAYDPVIATAYSLFIVGATSAVGSVKNYIKGNVEIRTGILIALPSFLSVYLTRRYIVASLPEAFTYLDITVTRHTFIMMLFAVFMLVSSTSIFFRKESCHEAGPRQINYYITVPLIALVGVVMGLVGAGGGFLIIPMLVFFGRLPMRKAIGTSLFIITLNSLTGFLGDMHAININWNFLLFFTMLSVFGIFAGTYLHKYINENQLKKAFGIFVLAMALIILSKEMKLF